MDFRFFLISIFSLYYLVSCTPSDYRDPRNPCYWYLKNSTGDLIQMSKNFYFPFHASVPNDSIVLIFRTEFTRHDEGKDKFNMILDAIFTEESLSIFDMNNVMLKTWIQSQRNDPGKQFFNEKYWKKRVWEEENYLYHEWTFELLPEDIQN